MPRIHFLSANRPGPQMGMGHYENLLFRYLLPTAPPSWEFGITWSGRAPDYFDRTALPPRLQERAGFLGLSVERLNSLPWPAPRMATRARMRSLKPDLWVSLSLGFPAPASGKTIYFVHDLPLARFDDEGPLPRWTAQAAKSADAIITPSEFAKRELMEVLGVPESKFHVLLHGCEHDVFHPGVLPEGSAELAALGIKGPFVFYAGGFTRRKNVPALLQAWREIAEEFPDLQLVMAGPQQPLQNLIDAAGAPRALAIGYLGRDKMPRVLKAAVCLACPSIYEGFGLPPQEAIALGVPVVTTRYGAIPEVVGESAQFADSGEAQDLASALRRLLSDEERQAELRRMGPERARQFSWEENARRTLEIYETVLKG